MKKRNIVHSALSLSLTAALCLSMAACGGTQTPADSAAASQPAAPSAVVQPSAAETTSAALPVKALNPKQVEENPYMAKSDANIHHDGYNTDSTDEILPLAIYPEINVSYETTNANASPAIYFDSYGHAVVPLLGGIAIRDLNAEETKTLGYFSPKKHDGGGYVIQSSYTFLDESNRIVCPTSNNHPYYKSTAILFKSRCGYSDVRRTVPDYFSFVCCRWADCRRLSRSERPNTDGRWSFVSGRWYSDSHSHASDCVSFHAVKGIYPAHWRNAALSDSRSHCPGLSYGNTPAGKRDGDLSPYFRSGRSYGRKPDARRFIQYFAACLCRFAALDRCYICRRIRSGSKKAILLKGKTYETIELFITRYSACFFSLCLPAGRSIFRRGSRPTGHYGRSNRIL